MSDDDLLTFEQVAAFTSPKLTTNDELNERFSPFGGALARPRGRKGQHGFSMDC